MTIAKVFCKKGGRGGPGKSEPLEKGLEDVEAQRVMRESTQKLEEM